MLSGAPSREYAVEVRDASKAYGTMNALTHLTLEVTLGSVFGLVGPKGAGKSTSLRTLAGLIPLDAGEAWVAGVNLSENFALARGRVGYMPEIFGTYGHLTVYEYLEFYGSSFGIRRQAKDQLYRDLLDLVDLLAMRDLLVDSLSPGSKQRLALARCLIHDPDVLLLDEPVRAMAGWESEELCAIVRELSQLGKTILFATEKVGEAEAVCDEIAVLKEGQIITKRSIQQHVQAPSVVRLELRLLNPHDVEVAARILRDSSRSSDVRIEGERNLSAAFSGKEEDAPAMLETIREAGVWVTGFALKSSLPEAASEESEGASDLDGLAGEREVGKGEGESLP